MRYIITESQYKLLTEGKIEFFQSLIDNELEGIRRDCEIDVNSAAFPNDLDYQACDEIVMVSKIIVNSHSWEENHDSKKYEIEVLVTVELDSVLRIVPYTLLYDLSKRINDLVDMNVHVVAQNVIPKRQN